MRPAFLLAPLGALGLSLLAFAGPGPSTAAMALPPPDLKPFPPAAAGERRWVIQLPALPPGSGDAAVGKGEDSRQVELIVGREAEVDCNQHLLAGRIESETVKGWGYTVHRVRGAGPMLSTLKACPPGEPKRRLFVSLGGDPYLVRYNPRLPIVIYLPQDLELRWRLWRAEEGQRRATPL